MLKRQSTMAKMLTQMMGMGLVMGVVFPIYADYFVQWIPARKLFFILGCLIAGVIVGLVNFMIANKTLLKPLNLIIKKANQAAEGDLTVSVDIKGTDIIGTLADTMNTMFTNTAAVIIQASDVCRMLLDNSHELIQHATENLSAANTIVEGVKETVAAVEKGSSDQKLSVENATENLSLLNEMISQIANGAVNQASNITTAAEKVHNMADAIKEVENSSLNLAKESQISEKAAEEGHTALKITILGMEKMQEFVSDASLKIYELAEKAQQIGNIIGVIDNIAQQTNLLSLNAAIEAARAGENGKGFAVVADEVRKLAEISSKSTKEITELLRSNQQLADSVIKIIEEGSSAVSAGAGQAKGASIALDNILNNIKTTGRHIINISSLITRISENSNEVSNLISNVTAVTQENSASTEEMAAGSSHVLTSVKNIASISSQSTESIKQISTSIDGMNKTNKDIAQRAQQLADIASDLQNSINRFKLTV